MGQESTTSLMDARTSVTKRHPIGVFDSGVGGLTVVRALRIALPGEDIVYLGDTARVPYGNKSPRTVERYSLGCQQFLLDRGVKLVLIACNTASANALPALQAASPVPVIGAVEPGAASALAATRCGHIGVIGTLGTVRSAPMAGRSARTTPRPRSPRSRARCSCRSPRRAGPTTRSRSWSRAAISRELFARDPEIDTLVLGCTHYPLLAGVLAPRRQRARRSARSRSSTRRARWPRARARRSARRPRQARIPVGPEPARRGRPARLLRDRHVAARRARAAVPRRAADRVRARRSVTSRSRYEARDAPLARASSALARFIASMIVAALLELVADGPLVDRIVGAEHEAVVERAARAPPRRRGRSRASCPCSSRLERAELGLEPGHQLAHHAASTA